MSPPILPGFKKPFVIMSKADVDDKSGTQWHVLTEDETLQDAQAQQACEGVILTRPRSTCCAVMREDNKSLKFTPVPGMTIAGAIYELIVPASLRARGNAAMPPPSAPSSTNRFVIMSKVDADDKSGTQWHILTEHETLEDAQAQQACDGVIRVCPRNICKARMKEDNKSLMFTPVPGTTINGAIYELV